MDAARRPRSGPYENGYGQDAGSQPRLGNIRKASPDCKALAMMLDYLSCQLIYFCMMVGVNSTGEKKIMRIRCLYLLVSVRLIPDDWTGWTMGFLSKKDNLDRKRV